MVDAATKKALSGIPLMKTKAGPRDKEVGRIDELGVLDPIRKPQKFCFGS